MKKFTLLFIFIILFLAIVFAVAQVFGSAQENKTECPPGTKEGTVCLKNPLDSIGVTSPGELVAVFMQGFAGIFGIYAVAFLVFSGFKLVIASNEEAIKSARESITWAVGGLVAALLSFSIISGAGKILGFEPSLINENRIGNVLKGPADPYNLASVTQYIMINFLGLVGFATTLMIIYYGYRYLTSAGSEEQIEQAKSGLKWALVGLAVVLLAFTIVTAIRQLLLVGPGK